MQKKVVHIILTYFLLIVFQLPVLIQLAHVTHEHNLQYPEICEGHDLENHIHNSVDSCVHIHKTVNPVIQIAIFVNTEVANLFLISDPKVVVVSTSKQLNRYASLRAPPKNTISIS